MFNPYQISKNGQVYRFISSGFIHDGWVHLGFNMFTFYFFGRNVEQIYTYVLGPSGPLIFVGMYLLAIVISDLPSFFKYKDFQGYNSLGASGGVSAVVFSSILYMPLSDICLYGFICLPGFVLGILYIIYSVYQGKSMSDNINHQAHLIGALFGVIFSVIINPGALPAFIEQISSYRIF
jgi:membrane associated rhomboid family serine protease